MCIFATSIRKLQKSILKFLMKYIFDNMTEKSFPRDGSAGQEKALTCVQGDVGRVYHFIFQPGEEGTPLCVRAERERGGKRGIE